jgi:uncharacterized protein YjiS (DUF1127 family)
MHTILPNGKSDDAARPPILLSSDMYRPIQILRKVAQTLAFWSARSRQRQALARLDEDRLRDIGVNRYDAMREAEKPFWRD